MSGATKADIRGWFDRGVSQGAEFMIVVCDSFDYDDYPVFCTAENYEEKHAASCTNMQRIMEVYDLSMDRELQLAEHRVFNGPNQRNLS